MTPENVAAELDALASRVRRLPPPIRAGNPDRFYEEQSEIANDLVALRLTNQRRSSRGPRPAMAANVAKRLWEISDIVDVEPQDMMEILGAFVVIGVFVIWCDVTGMEQYAPSNRRTPSPLFKLAPRQIPRSGHRPLNQRWTHRPTPVISTASTIAFSISHTPLNMETI